MELEQYNPAGIPEIFGLRNSGTLCYLNSLIQSLVSCPAFNKYLITNRVKYTSNQVVMKYLALLSRNSQHKPFERANVDDAFDILRELMNYRSGRGSGPGLSFFRQEDIHEGLTLFLDAIPGAESIFNVRYACRIYCRSCKQSTVPGTSGHEEPPELVIDMSDSPAVTKQEIEDKIKVNVQVPRDYTCEHCGAKNNYNPDTGEIDSNILQIYRLARLSEVIVLLFKKYSGKRTMYYPPELEFKSMTKNLRYRIVAQVEHFGNMYSGHYSCECLRRIPGSMFDARRNKADKMLQQLRGRLAAIDSRGSNTGLTRIKTELEERIRSIQSDIARDAKCSESLAAFAFDDTSVRYCPDGFRAPTPNTYIVFYHLV